MADRGQARVMNAGLVFNPPPGWPAPPPGWVPPADWQADPSWPPAPPGWQFWVQPPPAPKPRRRLLAWLVGGATLALLVVAAIVLWPRPAAEVTDAHIYGFEHSCVVTASGGVRCWGMNTYGELGDGTTTDRSTPVEVTGLRSPVASVATNAAHSCAVTTSGTVVCWGRNDSGQLGDGTTRDSPTPVEVTGLSGVTAVSIGGAHTCAVTTSDTVWCWGRNTDGQLGDGRRAASTTPVAVSGLGDVTAITTGVYHTCALTAGGTVWCWGDNNAGALGTDGEPSADEATPARVGGTGDRFVAVSAGTSHTCAVTAAGAVTCWGLNDGGQLGNGDTEASGVPVAVVGLDSGVTSLTAGSHHTCALLSSSAVRCWGLNTHGELGDGTRVGTLVPASIVGLDGDATALSGGGLHTCATLADHSTWCWGRNSEGQLGNGTTTDSATPTRVVGLP